MKPLPKHWLIHSAVLKTQTGEDGWQNPTYKEQTVSRIRVEPSGRFATDKENRQIQLAATLFYCCRNSVPHDIKFVEGQSLVFDGRKYRVETVEELYDAHHLHHYEVGLA